MPSKLWAANLKVTSLLPLRVRPEADLARFTVKVDALIDDRLRYFAYKSRVSVSAIVEVALSELFLNDEEAVLNTLKRYGASKRRRK